MERESSENLNKINMMPSSILYHSRRQEGRGIGSGVVDFDQTATRAEAGNTERTIGALVMLVLRSRTADRCGGR
jgi:hypothetical protein